MALRELNEDEIHAARLGPMRQLGENETIEVGMGDVKAYLKEFVRTLEQPKSIKDVTSQRVEVSGGNLFGHLVFSYGDPLKNLVIVYNEKGYIEGHYLVKPID